MNRKRMKDFLEREIGTRIMYSGAIYPLKKLSRYMILAEERPELLFDSDWMNALNGYAELLIEDAVIYIFDEDVKKELFEIYNEGDEDIFETPILK